MMRACVVLIFGLALAACATYEEVPLDPSALLAELRDVRMDLPETGLDPSAAVALALVHNPELRVFRSKHEIAAGLVISESAWENPELRFNLQNLYSKLSDPVSFGLNLRLFPALPGELDAKRARYEAQARRVLADAESEEARIAAETRLAHADVIRFDHEIRTVRAAVLLHERIGGIVRERIAAGVSTRIDETLLLLRGEELSDEQQSLNSERNAAVTELASLLGASPDAAIVVRPAAAPAPAAPPAQSILEDDALSSRPDLRALAEAYQEREQELHLAYLAQIPWPRHVQGGSNGISDGTSLDMSLAMEVPLSGKAEAEVAVAILRRDRARDAYRAQLHAVRREIRLALLDLREQKRRRKHLEDRVEPVLSRAEEMMGSALSAGAADVLAVVAIETRVLDTRRAATRAEHDYERARIRLAAATGTIHELE